MSPKRFFAWSLAVAGSLFVIFVLLPALLIGVIAAIPALMSEPEPGIGKQVAVIELTGMIADSREIVKELHKQARRKEINGIVLRIDSPGGTVGAAQEIYSTVRSLKSIKPIIASMGSVAASGGLYAALGASKVLCQPGTLTGSIGVIVQIPNFTKVLDRVGVDFYTLTSGELKDAGSPFKQLEEHERSYLQGTIDAAHTEFVKAVSEGRGIEPEAVAQFADGRIILGTQAVALGLADGFGTVYDASRLVFDELKKPLPLDEYPELTYPLEDFSILKRFMDLSEQIRLFLRSRPALELHYLLHL